VICGEAVWGTLEEVAKSKGIKKDELKKIVGKLNDEIEKKE